MSEMRTPFSVVICTRNRARLLERSIDSVLAQSYPREAFELIVVDNGSSDATPEVIGRCLARAPIAMSQYREPRAGVAVARNRGAMLARHEHVAFLDDDAMATPGWLTAYDAVVRSHGAAVVGGSVEPVIADGIAAPSWWREGDIRGLFGLDHRASLGGKTVARIAWPLWLGGGNTVYTRAVLREAGGFRGDLGPAGRRRRVAEDIDLNVRLERAGVPIFYAHDAVIRHVVTADRLARRRIWQRAYWAGRTDAAARALIQGRAPPWPVARLVRAALRYAREPAWTVSLSRLAYDTGYMLQSRVVPAARERR